MPTSKEPDSFRVAIKDRDNNFLGWFTHFIQSCTKGLDNIGKTREQDNAYHFNSTRDPDYNALHDAISRNGYHGIRDYVNRVATENVLAFDNQF